MLVGGGGNSSGQTVAELVKQLGTGSLQASDLPRVLLRELLIGLLLAVGLGAGAYPRVRLLSKNASNLDAVAIALSYMCIVVMANAIGVHASCHPSPCRLLALAGSSETVRLSCIANLLPTS